MRGSSGRWVIGCLVAAVLIATTWFWVARRRATSEAEGFQEFMTSLSLIRHQDGLPIADVIELEREKGIYIDVSFTPHETLPQEFGGQPVQEPAAWPFAVRIYPPSNTDASKAVTLRVQRYLSTKPTTQKSLQNKVAKPVPQGTTGLWRENQGYKGPPSPSKHSARQEVRLWTFLPPDPIENEGQVFELIMYPTARWLSNVRSRSGNPVVLRRGIIRLKS